MTGAYRRSSRARSTPWTPSPTRRSAPRCSAPRSTRFPTCRRCARSSGGILGCAGVLLPGQGAARRLSRTPRGPPARPVHPLRLRGVRRSGHADQLDPADGDPGPDRRPGRSARRSARPAPAAAPAGRAEPGWATTSYEPGDAIIFHCLTPHAALPNRGSALRLSGDFRWQRPDQPAPAELVLGTGRPAARDVQPAVPPRALVGACARRAYAAPPGADDHRPAGTLPADRRPSRLEALAATARGGSLRPPTESPRLFPTPR